MAENKLFDKGIQIAGPFSASGAFPVDGKYIVETIDERNDHVTQNRAYEGMLVYVKEDETTYQYTKIGWVKFGINIEYDISDLVSINATNVIQDSEHRFVTDEQIANWDNNTNSGNLLQNGTVLSQYADYAEIGEWRDGNETNEDRIGYFVCIDYCELDEQSTKIIIRKATSIDDVRGVTMQQPGFAGNASSDKFNENTGELLSKYDYVAVMGIVPVIDNGTCEVNGHCVPGNDGTAIPSTNGMGYYVINRIDENHILIIVEPGADAHSKLTTDINSINNALKDKASTNVATELFDGLMSADDKEKLDSIEAGANKYVLQTASEDTLGGIKAKEKTTESLEVAVDTTTGKAYVNPIIKVSEAIPTSEDTLLWISSSDEEYIIPEINDNTISTTDTWSSSKINQTIMNAVGSSNTNNNDGTVTNSNINEINGNITYTKNNGTTVTLMEVVYSSEVPTSGSHIQNEIIYSTNPVQTGSIGWVCIESGEPGRWMKFGHLYEVNDL